MRKKLVEAMVNWEHSGRILTGPRADDLSDKLARALSTPLARVKADVVAVAVMRHLGSGLNDGRIKDLAAVLAGTRSVLADGLTPASWDGTIPLPSLMLVLDMERSPRGAGRWDCRLDVLAGPLSGCQLCLGLSSKAALRILTVCAGWNVLRNPPDISGLAFGCILRHRDRYLRVEQEATTSSQKSWNRKLCKDRQNKCIFGLYDDVCFDCEMPISKCRLARHVRKHRQGKCRSTVTKHSGWITPTGWCRKCLRLGLCSTKDKEK